MKASKKKNGTKGAKDAGSLAAMTFDALLDLRVRLDGLIAARIRHEERELQTKLASLKKLKRGGASEISAPVRLEARLGRKLPPKYRNPKNKTQTWAGRGLRPRWLQDALKSGGRLEDFAV